MSPEPSMPRAERAFAAHGRNGCYLHFATPVNNALSESGNSLQE